MKKWLPLSVCSAVLSTIIVSASQDTPPPHESPPGREHPDDLPLVINPPRPPIPVSSNVIYSRGPFDSIQVNIDELGLNIPNDAANEPSIAIDPTNTDIVVIGWRQFDTVENNFRQAGYGFSHDGGQSWTFPGVLQPGTFRSDPVLGSDSSGNIVYYSLRGDFFCHVFVSDDGGLNWEGPVDAFGGDKAWMTIDKSGSVGDGNIYVAWSTAGNNYFPNQFTRSTDTGASFLDPIEIPQRPIWGTLTVDGQGDLYISGQDDGQVMVVKSTNAKFAAETPVFEAAVEVDMGGTFPFIGGDPNPAGLVSQVWIDADLSDGPNAGNIYIVASIDPPGGDPLNVMFSRSEDGGATWSAPFKINDEAFQQNAWQWFATMSVAPDGRIDVVWNDTKNSGVANLSELFYSYSFDGGETWAADIPASQMFDSHVGWPDQNKLGDYYHMVSEQAKARLAYAATFNGEQDVYYLELGDCNANGVHDGIDITEGTSTDFNGNNTPDDCECLADINASGDVSIVDLLELLQDWGPCPGCPADVNQDGAVDIEDLLFLLATWGPCP